MIALTEENKLILDKHTSEKRPVRVSNPRHPEPNPEGRPGVNPTLSITRRRPLCKEWSTGEFAKSRGPLNRGPLEVYWSLALCVLCSFVCAVVSFFFALPRRVLVFCVCAVVSFFCCSALGVGLLRVRWFHFLCFRVGCWSFVCSVVSFFALPRRAVVFCVFGGFVFLCFHVGRWPFACAVVSSLLCFHVGRWSFVCEWFRLLFFRVGCGLLCVRWFRFFCCSALGVGLLCAVVSFFMLPRWVLVFCVCGGFVFLVVRVGRWSFVCAVVSFFCSCASTSGVGLLCVRWFRFFCSSALGVVFLLVLSLSPQLRPLLNVLNSSPQFKSFICVLILCP